MGSEPKSRDDRQYLGLLMTNDTPTPLTKIRKIKRPFGGGPAGRLSEQPNAADPGSLNDACRPA